MAETINIRSRYDLEDWLKPNAGDQLVPWARFLAQRAALRVFPLVLRVTTVDSAPLERQQSLILQSWRGTVISLLADAWLTDVMRPAAFAARAGRAELVGRSTRFDLNAAGTLEADDAVFSALRVDFASHGESALSGLVATVKSAASAAAYAVDAAFSAPPSHTAYAALSADCQTLKQSGVDALKSAPLWIALAKASDVENGEPNTATPPKEIIEWMDRLPLLTDMLGPNAGLIDAWYQPRFAGKPPRFNDERARDFFIKNTGSDFWKITDARSGEDIMNDIAAGLGWPDDHSVKAKPKESPIAQLVTLTSPIPRAEVANGVVKIDIATNPLVDEPIGSDELADLPMIQRELCNSIRQSLPDNTPRSVDASLGSYERHLTTRGTRPSTRLLRQLGVAIIADFEGSEADLWNEGTSSLYSGFKENHLLLLEHYPLSEKVEQLLDQIELDEEAAVGAALEQPVLDVVEAAKRLSEIDLTTDDFDEFIEMMKTDVKNYASMPPVLRNGETPGARHSARKRYVVGTIGFLWGLYAFIANTASIASTETGAALLATLPPAIAALKALLGL